MIAPFSSLPRGALALLISFASTAAHTEPALAADPPPTESPAPGASSVAAQVEPAPAAAPDTGAVPESSALVPSTEDTTKTLRDSAESQPSAASDAEAASLEAQLAAQTSSGDVSEFKLNFYGFADFTYTASVDGDALLANRSTFAVGKLNLYTAAELGDDWRSLAEVRFMYLPNGSTLLGPNAPPRADTTTGDNTDRGRPIRWGGISIERAWLEHTFHPALTVRAGQWLTPYGIWNVDHGSPVIVGATRPYIVGEALFPERQTGLEIYGSWGFGAAQVGYHLTLSNGRGPIDSYQDLDNNKALGARLFWKQETDFGELTVGVSGYRGKYTDAQDNFGVDASGALAVNRVVLTRYDELSLAADAKWEWGGLLVQSEAILNDVAYDDGHRSPDAGLSGGPPGFLPDHRRFGFYALAGYRTSFLGVMPFASAEYYDTGVNVLYASAASVSGGINCRPTPRVVLKAQYTHAFFPDNSDLGLIDLIDLQAAWSF